ncbi:UrcA family protein [Sphingosinicella humi]|nr:UrcA family protein [Sphingosinicella humi]
MNRIIILAALVAAPLLAPAFSPALAQEAVPSDQTRLVSYQDLDLGDAADVRILDRRIRTAVEAACGSTSNADPAGKNEVRRCRAETIARVAAQREVAIAEARQPVRTASAD